MNTRAWALAAMTCAILMAPTSLADDGEEDSSPTLSAIVPEDPLPDPCVSMLQVTLVSFGGTATELDRSEIDFLAVVEGQLQTTITTITEVVRQAPLPAEVTDPLQGLGVLPEPVAAIVVETVETVETTVETIEQTVPVHVEWGTQRVDWDRIEATSLVPLPEDLEGVDMADVVTACDDGELALGAPSHGEYDIVHPIWYPEALAPETPSSTTSVELFDISIGLTPQDGVDYLDEVTALSLCPMDIRPSVEQALASHAPVIYEAYTQVQQVAAPVTGAEEGEEGDAEDAPVAEGVAESVADTSSAPTSAEAMGVAAKSALGGGLGLAGLVGTTLALRRK